MNRSWPVLAFEVIFALLVPWSVFCQTNPSALVPLGTADAGKAATAAAAPVISEADIPPGVQDLMRRSHLKYLEGSNYIKSGESAKARAAFDSALDVLLYSDYDLNSTPVLNNYFQDLLRRIQQDESRYLQPPGETEDKPEKAVLDELDDLDLIPIRVDPSLRDEVAADLANTKYDIPVVVNDKVLKSLDYWLTKGRPYFVGGLLRSGRYQDMIKQVFQEESIPLDVMYLAQVESLFKPNALSRARARGIWQFGRGTAIRYGLKVNSYVDERSDPVKSTRAAARYLSDLFHMFGDWNLVLAAYNWGEGKVQKLMERSGLNDFWEMTEFRRRNFPAETKNHVPLILASIILAHNPAKYGLPVELEPPLKYEEVSVAKPVDLRAVARILSITLDELKQLNPALRGLSTPANYPGFQLNVPEGSLQPEIVDKIAELPAVKFRPPAEYSGRYRVRSGDTLGQIAARHHVSVVALQAANPGITPKSLRAGSWIHVPGSSMARSGSAIRSTARSSPRLSASKTRTHGRIRSQIPRTAGKRPATTSSGGKVARANPSQKPTVKQAAAR